ncbi:MAG: glycine cleavage system protein GcvH [Pseudonocardia sp.]|nr:glycine cleavage system protein GcvH [Pseudonocardia sp.]
MTPEDLRYTAEHEWVRDQGDGIVRVGITDHAATALGDVVYLQLPETGSTVQAGDVVGEVESTKSVSELFSPLAGEVVAVNAAVVDDPAVVNSDAYGEGWMFDLRVSGGGSDLSGADLLDADAYARLIAE